MSSFLTDRTTAPDSSDSSGWSASTRRRLFGIDESEVTFAKRGFARTDPKVVARLEGVGLCFVRGYHAALDRPDPVALRDELARFDDRVRGFAYEGAGMALELLDRVTPWRGNRLASFLAGPGDAHAYMVTIGAGWAWARLPLRVANQLRRLDPILGWLALDGFGFHEGFFHTDASLVQCVVPRRVKGSTARRVFDAGLGRSLWFVCGADVERVADRISRFDPGRHPDLWSGTGLACCYAGGAGAADIDRLCALAGRHRAALAQGAAFAAKARERAGTPTDQTQNAVERICRTPAELAAKLCDTALAEARGIVSAAGGPPTFEMWRARIRASFEAAFRSHEEGA
jgi:hypothetical protein